MDCNKDEAHRAMELAGKKMQLRDFTSARKLIFKAQKLHNELENISQMLTVCDVHCAAAIKINGSEDWYNILQVQPMSDDPTIKKQYRKLALLLHPDKNKFAGSESAFKIIGEAYRTLSDPTKRAVYNMKRNTISNSTSTTTTNRPQFNRPNTNVFTRMNLNPNNNIFPKPNIQSTPQPSFGLPIFFTKCCHCGSQYKYPQNMMFRNIVCQNCEKCFAAIDLKKTQEVNSKVGGNDGAIDHEKKKTMAFNVTKVKLNAVNIESSLKDKSKGPNKSTKFNHDEISKDTLQTVKISQNPKRKIIDNEVNKKEKSISPSKFIKTKHVEVAETNSSRETLLHDISNYPDSEFFDFEMKRNDSVFAVNDIWSLYDDIDEMPRFYAIINKVRMENFKVWYTWLELTPSTPAERNWCDNDLPAACGNFHFGVSQTSTDLRMFSNIMSPQKESTKTHFVIHPNKGDIWALYKGWKKDTDWTQNPRNLKTPFDFEIVEVLSDFNEDGICVAVMIKVEKFVSLFTRLVVNDADVVIQIRPDEMLRFSHMVSSYRLTGKERDGSIPEGFFELDLASLPLSLIHVFPSISLEVAVAAQAKKISVLNSDTTYGANKKATKKKKMNSQIPSSTKNLKPQNSDAPAEAIQNFTPAQRTKPPFGNSDMNAINIPKTTSPLSPSEHSDFHNFQEEKFCYRFEGGQIWALYSDLDTFPKDLVLITNVTLDRCKILDASVIMLKPCPILNVHKKWFNKKLPFGCGKFNLVSSPGCGRLNTSGTIAVKPEKFSHHMRRAEVSKTISHYYIYPCAGEVWAIYRNWNIDWEVSDLVSCEYDIIEVITSSSRCIRGLVLVKVEGYNTVFMHQKGDCSSGDSLKMNNCVEIIQQDYLRFSHRVPAFRLTKVHGEFLQGCFSLDPRSIPQEAIQNFTPAQRTKPPFGNSDMNAINIPKTTSPLSPSEHSDFHNFQEEKFCYRFEGGQIWALYSDLDTFPKDLVLITNVTLDRCKILDASVIMLEPCPILNVHKKWFNKKLPFGCGKFNLVSSPGCGRLNTSGAIAVKPEKFSHHMRRAEVSKTISHYYIYPCAGEVWAIYRNWNIDWEVSDLVSCEYDIIEVKTSSSRCIRGLVLVKVEGYNTVFMHQKGDCSSGDSLKMNNCVEIIQQDYLRFSHRVPAFRLTKVHGEFLQGCFSLDPRSIPQGLLCDRD